MFAFSFNAQVAFLADLPGFKSGLGRDLQFLPVGFQKLLSNHLDPFRRRFVQPFPNVRRKRQILAQGCASFT